MALSKPDRPTPINALAELTERTGNGLARLQRSEGWDALPRGVRRRYERFGNQTAFLLHLHDERAANAAALRQETQQALVASAAEWNGEIARQADETEKLAMIQAKQNDLAAEYQAMNTTLAALQALHDEQVEEAMRQPAEHWLKPTLRDGLEAALTFGESELERRGLPPLTAGESWLNALTLGSVADKRLREHERGRVVAQAGNAVVEVIDAEFATK